MLFLITSLYFINSGNKFLLASSLQETSLLNKLNVSKLEDINFSFSTSSLSIIVIRSSNLFANSSAPEISLSLSKRLSIIVIDAS